ncbi:MAG TPA: TorF family putative porin [Pseudolabrys sp.]|jgi:uncharacterized protein (TIGR02001 family)|nr:TorF family putative porin [Pseudolabrys sp.]
MKKVVLSVVAALAVSAAVPALAADMPVKAAKVVAAPAPSPFDIAFGTALTTDYVLRGISQSNRKPAVQGYFELDYTATDWVKFYAGIWGSSLYAGFADAEFDISGGARFTWGNFGLDLGYVQYEYPNGVQASNSGNFGEFYAKPSYKFTDWLTVGAIVDGGGNFNDGLGIVGSKDAYYYSGNAVITLPWQPAGIAISLNPELGRQVYNCTTVNGSVCTSYTYWDVGLDFNYKAVTLDLRYWDTNAHNTAQFTSPAAFGGKDLAGSTFVATLKFDTTLSALK